MSDGPHRTLPMRPRWRRVAERADTAAFTPAEIGERLSLALVQEFTDLPPAFVRDMDRLLQIDDLFQNQKATRLESLRSSVAGSPLGNLFLDSAVRIITNGDGTVDLTVQAVSEALSVRGARGAAQVEEHYLREATSPRALKVRSRIEQGIDSIKFEDLGRQLLRRESASSPRGPEKQDGLDDGIQL